MMTHLIELSKQDIQCYFQQMRLLMKDKNTYKII